MTSAYTNQVWHGLLTAERLSRYYGKLASRSGQLNFWLTAVPGIASTGAAVTLILQWAEWATPLLFVIVSGTLAFSAHAGYARKQSMALIISNECRDLALEWKDLWLKSGYDFNQEKIKELDRRMDAISGRYDASHDHQLNVECKREAHRVCVDEFSMYGSNNG